MNPLFHLERHADAVAITDAAGKTLSYQALADASSQETVALPSERTLVAIEAENSLPSLLAYLGAMRRGHVPLLISADLPDDSKQRLYSHYGVEYVHRPRGELPSRWRSLDRSGVTLHTDLALLLSTSGSTGSPRLVRLSHANLHSNAQSIAQYLSIDSNERAITVLPFHYSFGLSVVHSHLLNGARLLLTAEPVTTRAFWDFFKSEGATSFSGVPATYEILRRMRFERMELPSLKTLTQAGGKLAPSQVEHFAKLAQQRGQRFFVMYGQTEATARMAYLPPQHAVAKSGSIGVAIPGGTLVIEENELVYSGPNVMLGYAENADDLSRGDELRGRLATGDLGHRDADGFFYIDGRKSRFIKLNGHRIALDEVEGQLRRSGFDAYATGTDEVLLIALQTSETAQLDAVQQLLQARYRLHHTSMKVLMVEDVPRTDAGKLRYGELLDRLQAHLARERTRP